MQRSINLMCNPHQLTRDEIRSQLEGVGVAVRVVMGGVGAMPVTPHEIWWTLTFEDTDGGQVAIIESLRDSGHLLKP